MERELADQCDRLTTDLRRLMQGIPSGHSASASYRVRKQRRYLITQNRRKKSLTWGLENNGFQDSPTILILLSKGTVVGAVGNSSKVVRGTIPCPRTNKRDRKCRWVFGRLRKT